MGSKGIGGHTKTGKGDCIVWLTPPGIIQALGVFDCDPCAAPSPRPWSTAKKHIELPENGLASEWEGRVWLNPPYDETLEPWMRKMALHGNGVALTFARTETEIWQTWVWPYATAILFAQGRLVFYLPNGVPAKGNSGGPSALIAYSQSDAESLWKSGIAGAIVEVKRPRAHWISVQNTIFNGGEDGDRATEFKL